ncbi:MAG: LysR family transcriptional regulator [Zymomonas mobilis subsp. pomaceae]|uniref:Transcriptional regulator, LysR family n=1 Tax=Zymomonas mobilis subsp. pomaceae (strain ATCC 29192 / DSM 22645 / JCM 10191 / CCUG 17912 / NBRC 13757 / NCIMB 11200 / NRRL B-4491 / Barker I) TaxID=579138 RepID=F8ET16_ZYMMT|nr:LysR family transcriptional regulator [Zymomonas mobilis]AEI37920.1 transcriptional regulator, LysR family [Zymomonas mobilis subsp. pomaceae ATCC 29192]MDX5949289.1 LysR family transcriptional regulator [Zymomonas mobilis subsp. pomaceae]GEB89704.1 transcriptional regulator [Zymomonas mobilis subsp. pomaceae]
MDNRIGEMQIFLRVVEKGSFSEAARMSLTTPSTVSKLIARIEARLGVRLIERSTRHLSVTTEGQVYYERAQALIEELEDIERSLITGAVQSKGAIRINTSVAFGRLALEPLLPAFWDSYPDILIDLSLSDEMADIYLDRTDIAFRVGKLQDSSLNARYIGTAPRKIVASPDYLKQSGIPYTIDDLDHHRCLGFNFRRAAPVWPLHDKGRLVDRIVRGPLLANNGDTVHRMALQGVGLARLAEYHVRDDLKTGRLIAVVEQPEALDEEDIHALYLGGRQLPQRVRVFLDFVVPKLQAYLNN